MNGFQELLIKYSLSSSSIPQGRNIVNFFICSAFEDYEIERQVLNNRIFPKVQRQCFDEFGMDIRLIDINLGLDATKQATLGYQKIFHNYLDKHARVDENNCPFFLLGQKYGGSMIPIRMPLETFELFQNTMRRYKRRFTVDYTFLSTHYHLDTTSIEPEMVLTNPSHSCFELSTEKDVVCKKLEEWKNIKSVLSDVFSKLTNICLTNGTLSNEVVQRLYINEFERTICNILDTSHESPFSPIIFIREIVDIKNFIVISNDKNDIKRKKMLGKLTDVQLNIDGHLTINESSQNSLEHCYKTLFDIYETQTPSCKILWRDDTGICERLHQKYMDEFETFCTNQIIDAVRQRAGAIGGEISSSLLKIYDFICDGNININKFSKFATGYEDICSALIDYVTDDGANIPMVICGPTNSGKAIILSRVIVELQNPHQETSKCHIITRFINPQYSYSDLLFSIFLQMSAIVLKDDQFELILENFKEVETNIPKDLEGVLFSFQQHTDCIFVIVLHDLEKCLESNVDDLIPKILPSNMKLILTTTESWEIRKPYFLNILVPEFTLTEFSMFIQVQLHKEGKYLSEEQCESLLPSYLKFTNDILTASMVVDYLLNNQLTNLGQEPFHNPSNINEFYRLMFEALFRKFGPNLISHSILFIHCSKDGLTDDEIVNLLNLDEIVIAELDKFHSESLIIDRDSLRFPLALWLLMKQQMSSILIERMKDGYLLVDLASASITEELINLTDQKDVIYFHKILADYYVGTWCLEKKSFALSSSYKTFHCHPRDQKMFIKTDKSTFYNYRKFRQLVRHLCAVGMREELLKNVIFNLDWLYSKIKALKVSELLKDFRLIQQEEKEIVLLEESLQNSALVIEKDLDSLAGELIVQLLPYVPYYPNLRLLIENCDDIAPKHNAFIPIYATNKLPGSPLASTINCPSAIDSVMAVTGNENSNKELLIKLKDDSRAYFYDLTFGEIAYHTLFSSGEIFIGSNDDVVLVLETEYRQIIKVHDRNSGDLKGQIIPMNWVTLRPFEERNKYRITNIDVAKTKVALLITNEASYLFVLNLKTLEPILAFNPGVRLQMMKLTADESTVFTHHLERLVSLDVNKNQLNSAVELQGIPLQMIFSNETLRKAFIVCNNQKSVVVLDLETSTMVSKCYKISFENCLDENDYVLEVSCSDIGNPFLLIRSYHSVILYDWVKEKVLSHITRPSQLPIYFKLPNQHENQPANLQFNDAKLILTDRIIVCALFRDIIVCTVNDNQALKTLHAPVGGIVSKIFIVDQYIIGKVDQSKDSSEVMIWKTDPSCLFSKIETNQDKLTKSVNKLHVGESVAIANCEYSDEMGVIEISTGTLVDLYSHSSPVVNSQLSFCGKWAFVTVHSLNNANILWSLEARKIVFEFGSCATTSFIIRLKSISGFLCILNHSTSIGSPNFLVNQICCDAELKDFHTMTKLEIEHLKFICQEPCSLTNDKILVFLCNDYTRHDGSVQTVKVLTIWTRKSSSEERGSSEVVTLEALSKQINRVMEDIYSIKTIPTNEETIMLLYKSNESLANVLLLNCKTKEITQFLEFNCLLPKDVDVKDIFLSSSGSNLFHQSTGTVIDLITGESLGTVPVEFDISEYRFQCFALRDTILVLSHQSKLIAWRLPKMEKIGQIELKEDITCLSKCSDDFTLMIGCADGSILSYALVDVFSPHGFLNKIKIVRNFQPQSRSSTIQLEPQQVLKKLTLSQEFYHLDTIKRPISEPIVAYERREFSNIF